MRIAIALLTLSVLGCTAKASDEETLQLPPYEPSVKIIDRSRPTVEFRKAPVEDLRNAVEATFRIGPDRRILQAVPLIDTLNGGNASSEVVLDFKNGGWVVHYKNAEIGRLPYLSDFDEGIALLTHYAASLPPQRGKQPSSRTLKELEDKVTAFSPPGLISALRTIDDQGLSLRDPRTSLLALRAFAFLQLQSLDQAGLGDPMFAKTLACLAIHRAARSGDDVEERALVADLMGYERYARETAAALPEASSLRRFINDEEVSNQPPSNLSLYLQTLQRVRKARSSDEDEDVQALVASQYPEPTRAATRLILEDTPFRSEIPSLSRRATIDELREISGQRKSRTTEAIEEARQRLFKSESGLAAEIDELEDVLQKAERASRGKLFDARTLRSYLEQNFYSGVWEEGRTYLSSLGSDEATEAFVASFGDQKRSRAGGEVKLWYDTARQLEFTKKDDKWLVARLPLFQKMSPHFRASLLESHLKRSTGWNVETRLAAAYLMAELDSRPKELLEAAELSRRFLVDSRRSAEHKTAAIETGGLAESEGWWFYYLTGQHERMQSYVEDKSNDPPERAQTILYLYKAGVIDERSARAKFEELLAEPASGGFLQPYAVFLNEVGDPATKQKSVEKWFELHPDAEGLTLAWHKYVLSNALERQGKYQEAYEVIEPYLSVWSASVVLQTASVLQRIGKPAEAIDLGQQAIARYGDDVRDELAPIFWRERRYAEAAELLNAEKHVISWEMRDETIPELFYESFVNAPSSERLSAFSALVSANVPVEGIPRYFARRKDYESSFELWSILLDSDKGAVASGRNADLNQALTHIFEASEVLEKSRGSEAARTWVLNMVPARATNEAVLLSHIKGRDAVTLAFSERPTPKPTVTLLLRAFAATRMKLGDDDPRYVRILSEVEAGPADDFFASAARYVLGRSNADDMLALSKAGGELPSLAAYTLAIRALKEGHYEAGNDWLIVTTLLAKGGEFALSAAAETLNRWSLANKSFAQIAKDGMV